MTCRNIPNEVCKVFCIETYQTKFVNFYEVLLTSAVLFILTGFKKNFYEVSFVGSILSRNIPDKAFEVFCKFYKSHKIRYFNKIEK